MWLGGREGECVGNGLRGLDESLRDGGRSNFRGNVSFGERAPKICAEGDEQSERDEEFQGGCEPKHVAYMRAVFAEGESEECRGEGEDC